VIPLSGSRAARNVMRVATDVLQKLPLPGDGPLTVVVKALAIYDSVASVYGASTPLYSMVAAAGGVEAHDCRQFVDLFVSVSDQCGFTTRRIRAGEHADILVAERSGMALYIAEWTWGASPERPGGFWVSRGTRLDSVMDLVWEAFGGSIHADFVDHADGVRARFSEVAWSDFASTSESLSAYQAFLAKHRRYVADGVPRTYLMHGPPGTGKTSWAWRLARDTGLRALRIGAAGLAKLVAGDMEELISTLSPRLLIIDDFSSEALGPATPRLLTTLAELRVRRPSLVTVITTNTLDLPPALLRPGRIDELIEFSAPSLSERVELLSRSGCSATLSVASASDGLTYPYLAELALQLRYSDPISVSNLALRMLKYSRPEKSTGSAK